MNKKEKKQKKNYGNEDTLIPDDPSSRTIFELSYAFYFESNTAGLS